MMRRLMVAAALAGALSVTAEARAGEDAVPEFRVFHDTAGLPASSKAAVAEVARLGKDCQYHEFSRMGPTEEQARACEGATARLIKHGPAAAAPILAALDNPKLHSAARIRLYNALARTNDTRLVEPLIKAMARVASRKLSQREWEFDQMERALEGLTRARMNKPVPWAEAPSRSDHHEQVHRVFAWRAWLEKNQGRSHDELAAEALAEARAHANDANPAKAYDAVMHLLQYAEPEGIAAAKVARDRADMPEDGKNVIRYAVEEAEERAREAAEQAAGHKKAPVKKTMPLELPKEVPAPSQKKEAAPPKKMPAPPLEPRS